MEAGTFITQQERRGYEWGFPEPEQVFLNAHMYQEYLAMPTVPGDGIEHVYLDPSEYKTRTQLPDRPSMLADLGSRINLIGRNTLERFISNARQHGHTVSLQTRERPIKVQRSHQKVRIWLGATLFLRKKNSGWVGLINAYNW